MIGSLFSLGKVVAVDTKCLLNDLGWAKQLVDHVVHYWVIRSEGVVKQVTKHPSQKLSAEKRADLFAVSSAEFAAHGFAKSSLNRIISQIGMSKSSFYHYFSNKADLFQQTLENAIEPFLAARDGFDLNTLTADTFWSVMESQTREMAVAANQSPELVMIGRMFYRSFDNPEEQALTNSPSLPVESKCFV